MNQLADVPTMCASPVCTENSRWGRRTAKRWVTIWQTIKKMTRKMMIVVRALSWTGALNDAYEEILSRTVGFGGGAKNAMEKS